MKSRATLLVIGILFVTVGTTHAQVVNGGFEADPVGTFDVVTGWEVVGKTSILDSSSNVTPTEGSKQLLLSTFGTGVATPLELAEFIFGPGTDPETDPFFDHPTRGRIIGGSAIKQTFTFIRGDSLVYDISNVSAEPFSGFSLVKRVGDSRGATIASGGVTSPQKFSSYFPDPDLMDIAGRPGGALVATQRMFRKRVDDFLTSAIIGPGHMTLIFAELMVEGLGDAGSGILLDNIRLVQNFGMEKVILGAEVNLNNNTVLISVQNFDFTVPFSGVVRLFAPMQGELELNVLAFDDVTQEILAELPPGIEDTSGTYRLTVGEEGFSPDTTDDFDLTIVPLARGQRRR